MKTLTFSLPLLAALLGACATTGTDRAASAVPVSAAAPRDCRQLETERAAAEALQREAEEQKDTAWKAVVPFAVAGRVLSANHTIRDSERRLAALDDEARQLGCRSAL